FIEDVSSRDDADEILSIVRLGLEHEMQHQELLVYDIKHLLCDQFDAPIKSAPRSVERVSGMVEIEGGLFELGVSSATVREGEYLEFMNAGGYQDFRWWHSAGWEKVNTEHWRAPLYWEFHDGEWMIRDFAGLHRAIDKANEPVSHVSFLEASAYAKWVGKRLP